MVLHRVETEVLKLKARQVLFLNPLNSPVFTFISRDISFYGGSAAVVEEVTLEIRQFRVTETQSADALIPSIASGDDLRDRSRQGVRYISPHADFARDTNLTVSPRIRPGRVT